MSLLDDIKGAVRKSGTNKGKLLYFKPGVKVRIRFLQDMEGGFKLPFHDSFALGINVICQEVLGKICKHCDNDELRHRDQYAWSVWDYEAKEVKILLAAVNNCSPIPSIVGLYDSYGTLTDRDYVITKQGSGTTASFTVVPMDKVRFKNPKAKPFSESKMLSILDKAFPEDDEGDEEEEAPRKRKPAPKKKGKKIEEDEEDYDDEDYDDEDEEEEEPPKKSKKKSKKVIEEEEEAEEYDYEEMTPKELYTLCKEREIKVKPKMDEEYYIEKLEEYDEEEGEKSEW